MPKLTENSILHIFGNGPYARVLEFFVTNKNSDFTISQIAERSDIARTTLWGGVLKKLLDEGIITKSREIGNAKLFKLNTSSKKVKILLDFYNKLKGDET